MFGDDPTVNALQERLAGELGFEAGLFVASGTQSNLLALMAHCERGDEYLVGSEAHTYKYEGGGAAVLGSIQPQPIPQAADGTLPLDLVATRDQAGRRFAFRALAPAGAGEHLGRPRAAARLHRRGRRRWRARADSASTSTARGCSTPRSPRAWPAREIARDFDSVSVCFSKGLGAPVGSMLLGTRRRWSSARGAGARCWAAAGARPACSRRWPTMRSTTTSRGCADDHRRARELADALRALPGLTVDGPHTNMVFVTLPDERAGRARRLHAIARHPRWRLRGPALRLVLHLDIDDAGLARAIAAFEASSASSRKLNRLRRAVVGTRSCLPGVAMHTLMLGLLLVHGPAPAPAAPAPADRRNSRR